MAALNFSCFTPFRLCLLVQPQPGPYTFFQFFNLVSQGMFNEPLIMDKRGRELCNLFWSW